MAKIIRPMVTWGIVIAVCFFAWKFLVPLFSPEEEEKDIQTAQVRRGDLRKSVPADGVVEPYNLVEVKSKASGFVEEIFVETGDLVVVGQILLELDKEVIRATLRQAEADVAASRAQLKLTQRDLSPQQRASAESSIRQAEITLKNAQASQVRIAGVHAKGYASDQELQDAQRSVDQAHESLEQAQDQYELDLAGGQLESIDIAKATLLRREAELDNVLEELANTTIRAPMSGTVLTRSVEIGTTVASGTSGNTGGTVTCTIGDLSKLKVIARIEETDLGRVKVNGACRITFDSYEGWVWQGILNKIEPQGDLGGGGGQGTQFPVEIGIDLSTPTQESVAKAGWGGGGMPGGMMSGRGPGGGGGGGSPHGAGGGGGRPPQAGGQTPAGSEKPPREQARKEPPTLYPNMTASVEIVLEDHPGVLIVPAKFIQYDQGQPYVEVAADPSDTDSRERFDITLGFSDGLRFEVKDGVSEGDTLVLERAL